MTVAEGVNLKDDRMFVISWGLIYKCVCAPASWKAEQVSDEATRNDPPITSANRWVVTESLDSLGDDHPFKNANPIQCPDDPERRHWLVNC